MPYALEFYSLGPRRVQPTLALSITPPSPALSTPGVSNGDLVATLSGIWSDGAAFTGRFVFVAPNFDHGGDYKISGTQLQVANATNLNALGSVTIEHVTIEAAQ